MSSSVVNQELTPCVTMPMFTINDDFISWEQRFKLYCDIYNIEGDQKRIQLLFLMDNQVAYILNVNQLLKAEYEAISKFLCENFNRNYDADDAILELDSLTDSKIENIEDLDIAFKKIDELVEIGYAKSSHEIRRNIKISRLSRILPKAVDNSYLNSKLPTFYRAKIMAKILWKEVLENEDIKTDKTFGHHYNELCGPINQKSGGKLISVKCNYCKEYGHMKYSCPRKRKTYKSGGHMKTTYRYSRNY
uniref:CCHC-type domain-containing protein n=1 Tax=Strongyloides papillosus TaxID=174720 RepID=A0A0N5B3W6_STREA